MYKNNSIIMKWTFTGNWIVTIYISGVYEYIPNNNYNRTISYPYFDTAGERNVTSYAGQTTHLHCVVKDLGDKMVSNFSIYHKSYWNF